MVIVTVVSLLTAGACSQAAQARWSAVTRLGHRVDAVAGNARGEQVLVWDVFTRKPVTSGSEEYGGAYVRARIRAAGGRLLRPQTLTRTDGVFNTAGVGIDRRGTATALMIERARGETKLLISVRAAGHRFTRPVVVGHVRRDPYPDALKMIVAPDGAAVVAWSDGLRMRAVRRPAGRCATSSTSACFGSMQDLGARCPASLRGCIEQLTQSIAMTFTAAGGAAVAWTAVQRLGGVYATVIRYARTHGPRGFSDPQTISHGSEPSVEPTIAALGDGRVVAAWTSIPTYNSARIHAALLDRAGRASAAQTLSGKGCHEPRAAVNRYDEVTLAWRCRTGGYDERLLSFAVRPADSVFGPQTPLAPHDAVEPTIVVDAQGNTFVFFTTNGVHVHLRIRAPGQAMGPDMRVADGAYPDVVASSDGVTVYIQTPHRHTTMRDWID